MLKFANFTHRDPYRKNAKFKICSTTAPNLTACSAATSHVQWSWREHGRGSAFSSCEAKPKQRERALYFSFTAFATVASLETASLVTRRQQVASTKKSVVGGGIKKKGGGLFCFATLATAKQSAI